jgi:DNA-binding MarR family transcriptional regulator
MREVNVTLSAEQVQAVVHQATASRALGQLFSAALDDPKALRSFLRPLLEDGSYSQSVLRALIVLASFPADGTERELTTVAGEVGLAPGTTHRYLHTWTAAGLLERDAVSRRYRRAPLATPATTTD